MSSQDPYAEIAPFYDLEFNEFDADVELYLGYARLVGGPVLELGCGSGRLIAPLVNAGYDVTGVDSSPSMLQLARDRFAGQQESGSLELIQADIRALPDLPVCPYRLVFSSVNSFLHLETREDQIHALGQIRNVLDRDGLLIIDVFNPTPEALTRMDDRFTFDAEWNLDNGERVQRFSYRQLDSSSQLITTRLFYDRIAPNGDVRRSSTTYTMRYVHRFELEALLAECGFVLEGTFGSYSLDPPEHDSTQLIVVAHRTANPEEA